MQRWIAAASCALALCTGCYDAHGSGVPAPRDAPDVAFVPGAHAGAGMPAPVAGTGAPSPAAGSGAAGTGAAPVEPGADPDARGCKTGAAAVWRGDFDTSPSYGWPIAQLRGVQEVQGLLIVHQSDSVHLDELTCLRKVESLHVMKNGVLESLRGLAQLQEVPGFIYVTGNPNLRDLRGLSGVRSVLGSLPHWRCPEDAGCRTGALVVQLNNSLTSLAGLEGIREVLGGVAIRNNRSLVSLAGLENVSHVGGTLMVSLNSALESLAGLAGVTLVDGNALISNNPQLREIGGPLALREVVGELDISSNDALASLAGLSALEVVGGLSVVMDPALHDLAGLDALRIVGKYLTIGQNALLDNVDALANVRGAVGEKAEVAPWDGESWALTVEWNPALRSLSGLAGIDHVGGNAGVLNNESLTELGLNGLVTVADDFEISGNAALRTLDGLQKLERVGRALRITTNASLVDVSALASLQYVGWRIEVSGNSSLGDAALPDVGASAAVVSP